MGSSCFYNKTCAAGYGGLKFWHLSAWNKLISVCVCLPAFQPRGVRLLPDVQQQLWWGLPWTRWAAYGQLQSDASWTLRQRWGALMSYSGWHKTVRNEVNSCTLPKIWLLKPSCCKNCRSSLLCCEQWSKDVSLTSTDLTAAMCNWE